MEINKLFLTATNIISNFDGISKKLDDVNCESVNNFDIDLDDNAKIIKESSQYNLKNITSDNKDEILKNTNGKKTFIIISNVIGDQRCGKCKQVASKINQVAENMSDEANFVELNYSESTALYNQLKKDSGYQGSVGFPAIIVCDENGKPEKLLNNVYEEAKDVNKLTELYHHVMSGNEKDEQINQKGTTFIYINDIYNTQETFQEIANTLGSQANFMELDYTDDNRLIKELATKANGGVEPSGRISGVIKCVDGVPVEIIPQGILKQADKNPDLINDYFTNKIAENENIEKLTTDNADTYLRGTKGTTYVVMGNTNCSYCVQFEPYLNQIINNIGDDANFLEITYSANKDLCHDLKNETGYQGKVGFPIIIKCVDGKAVEMIDVQNYMATNKNGKYKDIIVDDYTKKLKSKIEGEYKDNPNKNVNKTEENKAEHNIAEDDNRIKNKLENDLISKQKLQKMQENIQSSFAKIVQEFSSEQIEAAIENAVSFYDLKDIVLQYSMYIDFETQQSLISIINGFDENSDLDVLKEKLLNSL